VNVFEAKLIKHLREKKMIATSLLVKLFLNLPPHKEIKAKHKEIWQYSATLG